MRFNAAEYVEQWKENGKYPAIHNAIFSAINVHGHGGKMLDLCCSTGLLGKRIAKLGNYSVIGVESDKRAIELAQKLGNDLPIYEFKINRPNLEAFMDILKNENVTAIAARRCIPELFGEDVPLGMTFVEGIYEHGVQEVFLEGRVKTKNATNVFNSIEKEIELFVLCYDLVTQNGNVAYLRRKAD